MSARTPGPWRFHDDEGIFSEDKSVLVPTSDDYNAAVGLLVTSYDACLIAAAPDLLEALKAIQKIGVLNPTNSTHVHKVIADMVAAIKKAEGRS
jgi:hypothetical protein